MTQASQALPSWLTLSSTVITDADGSLSTSFVTLTLPLTYYGPSIPLGTDGTWTYGGLSSPAPTTISSTTPPPSPSATPSSIPPVTSSALSSTSPSPSSSSASPTSPAATSSRGLSRAALGGLIGGILGFLLLLILLLTLWVLRRNRSRRQSGTSDQQTTSSFWNRQTTLFTADPGTSTPIWTGWDLVSPTEAEAGIRTPGEGSPRHSGEEADPFLTRRTSGTIAEEMAQTKTGTDTLVSVPAAAAVIGASTIRPSPPRTGNILPRDVISRMMDDGIDDPPADIRIVEPTPRMEHSPLLPPPMLNPDALSGIGIRGSRNVSQRSLGSQNRSIGSQKSLGSLEEDAELRVARRVRVSELDPDAGPSRNTLGLNNLSGRLGRFSWFRRMSLTSPGRAASPSTSAEAGAPDSYTRSPTRSSYSRHASRPSSYVRFQDDAATGRPPRVGSGVGYNTASSRPISSVSAKSTSAASGNTVYHDAVSTPTSEVPEVPEIPERFQTGGGNGGNGGGSSQQQPPSQVAGDASRTTSSGHASVPNDPPPTYDDNSVPRHRAHTRLPSDIDVLDLPAPPPVSPFTTSRPAFSPGLGPILNTWRESYPSNQASPGSSADIAIDIEDAPPVAVSGWRTLSGGGVEPNHGRRTTFGTAGTPTVVNPPISPMSEQGSLHYMRSHLSPYASRSAIGSAPASTHHTLTGSGSSRPSAHSHARTGSSSLAHSNSVSSLDQRGMRRAGSDLASPPLSAVFGGRTRSPAGSRPASPPLSPSARRSLFPSLSQDISPTSSRTPLLAGTGEGTVNSQTNSSVTTALTDPITGTVMHFPSMPWRNDPEHEYDARWNAGGPSDEEWS